MRTTVFVGTSFDGFIARPGGELDFLDVGGGEPHGFEKFFASIDAIVMGRMTYEIVLSFGGWHYGEIPVFVLSTRPIVPPPEGAIVEHMSGAPSEIVAELASRGVEHLYVDGGITIQQFLREGLIDRIIVTRVPVLIGEGIPLFGPLDNDVMLRHVATRSYASGLVQSEYEVEGLS